MVCAYALLPVELIGFAQRIYQQGVIIQHFFEMRGQPFLIGGITRKTAAQLIVNAAIDHLIQRQEGLALAPFHPASLR